MGKRSSVTRERPEVREAIDTAIREGRATLDEIVAMVREMDSRLSRTAIGVYRQNAEKKFEQFRAAQETAKVWATKVAEEPEGDVAMLVGQVLKVVSLNAAEAMANAEGEDAKPPKAMDVMLLAKALDHLSKSENQQLARAFKIREQTLLDAAKTLRASGKRNGVSEETIQQIERDVLKMKA